MGVPFRGCDYVQGPPSKIQRDESIEVGLNSLKTSYPLPSNLKLVLSLEPEGISRSVVIGTDQPSGVVVNSAAAVQSDFAEHRWAKLVFLLITGKPVLRRSKSSKPLRAELELGLPSVLQLPLISQLHRRWRDGAVVLAKQYV